MLNQAKNIFFLGIKGVAMANLAVILKKLGKQVDGVDVNQEFITDKLLRDNKINWQVRFNKLPQDIDLVVYSAAHGGLNNPLIAEAKKRKINVISQAEVLGELMNGFEIKIAVSGCHGKTTTSSLLSYALHKLQAKPSYLVGVPFFTGYQGADYQEKKYFIVEADEYGVNPPQDKTPKFFKLDPDWIICTNIDFDHPDVYRNIEETNEAFLKFFYNKKLILNADDANLLQCFKTLKSREIVSYGFSDEADYQIVDWRVDEEGSEFEILHHRYLDTERSANWRRVEVEGSRRSRNYASLDFLSSPAERVPPQNDNIGKFETSLFGKHNISNAAAVIVQLLQLGFKAEKIKKAVVNFKGAERRSELIYKKNDTYLLDDYAHHPNEIKATIEAAKERFKGKRIIVIFQPHTYSRTNFLLKDFRESLALADISFVLPIFASAREIKGNFKIGSMDIVKGKANLFYVDSNIKLINQLDTVIKDGDVIFTMGAGNVYKLKDKIIKIINVKCQMSNVKSTSQNLNLKKNVNISNYLTLRTPVKAEYFIEAKTREDLIEAKKFSIRNGIPIFILGGGSNLAITKEKINGVAVKNNYRELKVIDENKKAVLISVSSGYSVNLLVAKSIQNGWSGFEYHQGLPGTVGGGIYMNSKWTKPPSYFGDYLSYAYLANGRGEVKKVGKEYFKFAYDYSILQKTKEIVLEAVFKLKKSDPKAIREKAAWALEYRKKTQPFGIASSGCFFKNISVEEKEKKKLPTTSAGYLIDKAGLKGFNIGNYFVSPIHANFIINKGKGKGKDLIKLLSIIKEKVKHKFGVELKEEVIVI